MDNITTQLKDGAHVGVSIKTGPGGEGVTPVSGLQIM
jgi:hypothetical protein